MLTQHIKQKALDQQEYLEKNGLVGKVADYCRYDNEKAPDVVQVVEVKKIPDIDTSEYKKTAKKFDLQVKLQEFKYLKELKEHYESEENEIQRQIQKIRVKNKIESFSQNY